MVVFFFTDKCTLRKEDSGSKRGLQESGDSMGHGTQATQGVGGYRRRAGSEHRRPVRSERSQGAGATVSGGSRQGGPKRRPQRGASSDDDEVQSTTVWPGG